MVEWFVRVVGPFKRLLGIISIVLRELLMGRVIITIDDIVAGRGLRSNKASKPPAIEIFLGNGLMYGEDDNLSINVGPGLGFAPVPVVFEEELPQGKLKEGESPNLKNIIAGPPLMIMNEELAGIGLRPGPGSQLDLDDVADPTKQQVLRLVTNCGFQMDGYNCLFCVTHTNFIVHRNCAGFVVGIEEGDSEVTCQPPCSGDGYGGPYGSKPMVPPKPAAPNTPRFYKT
jgi:hypothetical protein